MKGRASGPPFRVVAVRPAGAGPAPTDPCAASGYTRRCVLAARAHRHACCAVADRRDVRHRRRDLDGRPVSPLGRARPPCWSSPTTDCPISNRYAPEIQRLAGALRGAGVRFWARLPRCRRDTGRRDPRARRGVRLRDCRRRDAGRSSSSSTGVTVTPEVAVIDAPGGALYRGRIDDRYVDFGVDRPAADRRTISTTRSTPSSPASRWPGRETRRSAAIIVGSGQLTAGRRRESDGFSRRCSASLVLAHRLVARVARQHAART